MVRAFAAGAAIAVLSPLIGIFLVLRRYSLLADTLAHVALTGVAIGLLLGTSPVLMAVLTTVVAAILIERLRNTHKIYGESALAIFLSGSLAIAVVLISLGRGFNVDLFSFLFGSIAAIRPSDLYTIAALGAMVAAGTLIFRKELLYLAVDEDGARISGIRAEWFNTFLIVAAAITVSLAMRIVGVLLVGALMVIPVIAAFQIARSFRASLCLAVFFSLISAILGLFASYYLNIAAGGAIVLVALFIFLFTTVARVLAGK